MSNLEKDIFRSVSTTFYWSAKLFPKGIRDDVLKLYSFVHVVDDMADKTPSDDRRFQHMVRRWRTVKKHLATGDVPKALDDSIDERVLHNIAFIVHRYECDPLWVDVFLKSMRMDIDRRRYETLDEVLEYVHGSAEVIGLFMSRIMQLPIKPYEAAKLQGRAMRHINFLRDIAQDSKRGRCYFPARILKQHGLMDLNEQTTQKHPAAFKVFASEQLSLYEQWQAEAEKGFAYIPKRLLLPLKTAVAMHNWVAEEIKKDPFVVYRKNLQPTKKRVLSVAARYSVR